MIEIKTKIYIQIKINIYNIQPKLWFRKDYKILLIYKCKIMKVNLLIKNLKQ
jgi:hypothetical protein